MTNRYQQARQIAHMAKNVLVLPSGEPVFQDTWISGGVAKDDGDLPDEIGVAFPFFIVRPGDKIPDGEHKHRKRCSWSCLYGVSVKADATGEAATIGFIRDPTSIEGYGILEIEEFLEALFEQTSITVDGLEMSNVQTRMIGPSRSQRFGYVMLQTLEMESYAGSVRRYPGVCELFSTAAGGGSVTLSWDLANGWARAWNQNRQVLRRAVGSTPPATITSGTDVPVAVLDTGVVVATGAGTHSFSLFNVYDEIRADVLIDQQVSRAATLTVDAT